MAWVLVVDDQPEVRKLLETVVKKAGYEVKLAASSDEAWKLLPDQPGIILADIDMPGETGVEFVLRLREQQEYAEIPVVFVTAFRERAAPLMATGAGVVDIIDKPFRIELVHRVLERVLGKADKETAQSGA